MSISSIEIPRCFSLPGSVRTRAKILSPCTALVVHTFWPLTTKSSPSRTPPGERLVTLPVAANAEVLLVVERGPEPGTLPLLRDVRLQVGPQLPAELLLS